MHMSMNSGIRAIHLAVVCVMILFRPAPAQATTVNVSATADRTRIAMGEQVVVTLKVVSDKALPNAPPPVLPESDEFSVVRTSRNQSQNSSIQIVNGRMVQNVEITYFTYFQIAPRKEGTFTFPSVELVIEGKAYTTKPFDITVTREPVENPDVRLRLLLSKTQPHAGEQVILTLETAKKAQSPAQLTEQGFRDCIERVENAFGGAFSVHRLFTQFPKGVAERIDGEYYHVFKLQWALFPLTAGPVSITPVSMDYIVNLRVQRRNVDPFFGDFFGGGVQQVAKGAVSNAMAIRIRELPPAPTDFSGAVGRFRLSASVDPQTIAAGEAVTLKMTLSGNTRPGGLTDPKVPRMDGFEVFPPERQTAVDTTENGIAVRRTYRYLIIPRKEGNRTILPITWTYFDPAAQAFKTLSTDSIRIEVTKGQSAPRGTTRYLTQSDIREVGQDIRFIKLNTELKRQPRKPYLNPLLLILLPAPFALALFSFLYRLQSTRQRDMVVVLRKSACGRALREVRELRRAKLSDRDLLNRIAAIIERFISHKFSFAATGRTLDELQEELSTRGINAQMVSELVVFIRGLDIYRFGGVALDEKGTADALTRTHEFILKLDRAYSREGRK